MSNKSAITGLAVTAGLLFAGIIIAVGIIYGTPKIEKVNGQKVWVGKKPENKVASGGNGTNTNPTNNNNKKCTTCSSPPPSPRGNSGVGFDAIPLTDPMAMAAMSMTAPAAASTSMVTFADNPQVIHVPNDPTPALQAVQAQQAAIQASQAFAGEVPASILKRQAADTFTLASILPPGSAAAQAIAGAAQQADPAGALMSSLAPNRDKLFAATTQVSGCRMPVLNGRSPKSRLVGQSSLLRPPAPMPCKSTTGGEVAWGDSDLRHYALENNMPPIAA